MKYLSVAEVAKKWNISDRSVRNYCAHGRVPGAFLAGKTWNIPVDSLNLNETVQTSKNSLLNALREQKKHRFERWHLSQNSSAINL